jgi:hypothetical protein
MPRDVHLVGSVPGADAAEVFERVSAALGPRLRRIPDGETGERQDWIVWLEKVFADSPALEKSDEVFRLHATATPRIRYRVRPGRTAADVTFDNLFYADIAERSYRDFARLKREIDKIAARLPHDEIAIQFDVASAVFARLERNDASSYGRDKAETLATFGKILVDLGNHVPRDIELLFHFCYGDSNHRHVVEPTDMADMVAMANRLSQGMARSIELIHMPVPRNRADDSYFVALKGLELKQGTKLSLGLVHHTDGVEGTRRRLAGAERVIKDFSIATECGFGRRRPETIAELLRIHAEAAG